MGKITCTYFCLQNLLNCFYDALQKLMKFTPVGQAYKSGYYVPRYFGVSLHQNCMVPSSLYYELDLG
jgi:hypothetical protein